LKSPTRTVTAIPIFQERIASPVARYAGPSTAKDIPKTLGAFKPRGIAVMSSRPVLRASLRAIAA
jgi:hypothetical protein